VTDAERLEACLAGDGVAAIPTDTVYGLAGIERVVVGERVRP
jgi:tRNA A37 threonylcarbamoyladenosine synthetase subunit TsaC/SUA5/YrdC